MNNSNISRLRQIMNVVRTGRGLGNPQSSPILFQHLGVFASGLNKISMFMQQYAIDNKIQGMSDPEAYNKAMFAAQLGLKMGNVGGARLVRKFVEDHYRYVVHPAIRSIGKAGGKYGEILENYMQAKTDIKKSWGDIGAQIGSTLALGVGLFTKGLRTVSLAAGATGFGVPAALVGLAASFVVNAVASMILPWIGRKIGETIAVKSGYVDKFANNVLGGGVLNIVPQNAQHFQTVANSVVGQKWYDNTFTSYMDKMEEIAYTPKDGVSLHDLGIGIQDTGMVYDSIGKSMRIDPSYRGYYTQKIAGIKGITGMDVSDTFAGISQGSALSKKSVSSNEIDKTADAFAIFLDAVSQGSKGTSTSAIQLTKSLAQAADVYARSNIDVKDVDVMFSGVQKFVQKNMQAPGKQDTTEATDIIGIMNGVAKSSGNSPLATRISNYAGIDLGQSQRGLGEKGFENMSMAFSSLYNFGGDSSVDKKTGALKLGRKGENAWAKLYLDATAPREKGGLGLTDDQAQELIKYVVAFQTNPDSLKFGGAVSKPLEEAGEAVRLDTTYKILQKEVQLTDTYQKLASTFTGDFITLGDSVARAAMGTTEKIASGAIDLLEIALRLSGVTPGDSSLPASFNSNGTPVFTNPTRQAGNSVVEEGGIMIAQKGFKEEISGAAGRAGLELKTLYAFLGAESRFGANVSNYAGKDYVGVGQIGAEAQNHMNRIHGTDLNRNNRTDNIQLAAYYADYLRDRYVQLKKTSFSSYNFDPNDPRIIYIAYNWGMGNLDKHIKKYGGINWSALPRETQIGVGNVEKALRGYDAVQGVPVGVSAGTPNRTVMDKRGVWRFAGNGLRRGRFDTNVTLLGMSGVSTRMGNKTAQYIEDLYKTSGNTDRFYKACAAIANAALASSGYRVTRTGTAESDLNSWIRGHGAAVMSYSEAQRTGFQPGDLIYVQGGNHVGIVTFDGSILQAGTAYDDDRNTNLIRTDIKDFTYGSAIIVIRPSADNGVSAADSAPIKAVEGTLKVVSDQVKSVKKTVKGSSLMVNALVEDAKGNFTVKKVSGAGLSKVQIARIKAKEAALEKVLGLKSDQLILETKSVAGGTILNVKINAPMADVGKIAQDIIREIERLL